ncbi:MAG: hypothetical protein JRF27_03315 [Deltaproteobacteria bacterium]|nr:hypothetical protein [Deltaproteobacteria bacterium]MBW2192798.1 hypothetical protein [Deltaproteobacteria bacterium]
MKRLKRSGAPGKRSDNSLRVSTGVIMVLLALCISACTTLQKDFPRRESYALSPENSWQVPLDDKGQLSWVSSAGTIETEPARNSWQRFQAGFFGLLPIEDLL